MQTNVGPLTFAASAALGINLRVKLNGSGQLEAAGATEQEIGTNCERALAAGDLLPVETLAPGKVVLMVAAGAFAQYASLYGAASGKVDGKIYVIGGWQPRENINGQNSDTVEVFDGQDWSFVSWSGSYDPVRSPAYATAGGKIYLFGGCVEGSVSGGACPSRPIVLRR